MGARTEKTQREATENALGSRNSMDELVWKLTRMATPDREL
jgi:hypothetical protein